MSTAEVKNLRHTLNPWQDFDKSLLEFKVRQLLNLVSKLNEWLPNNNKIISEWNFSNHQQSVNNFHIHFPEQEKNETDVERRLQLSQYNDLIHEIEMIADNQNKQNNPYLLICPDGYETVPLEINDYKYFRAKRTFGELCLHYCHVGRHPFELYYAGDINCPVDQIIPQKEISTFHTLRFYDDPYLEHYYKPKFRAFYERSTLKQLLDFNDPTMAFGYIPMGKLVTDSTQNEILEKVKNSNKIISWKVY